MFTVRLKKGRWAMERWIEKRRSRGGEQGEKTEYDTAAVSRRMMHKITVDTASVGFLPSRGDCIALSNCSHLDDIK